MNTNPYIDEDAAIKEISPRVVAVRRMIIAAWILNEEWTPDWHTQKQRYGLTVNADGDVVPYLAVVPVPVCFRSRETALRAISLLGEETIKASIL